MSVSQSMLMKRSKKQEREHRVLMGLVRAYLSTGKPIGSNTLKEAGFNDLSSATIRNYFSQLEKEGYLVQQHASGGRIPTNQAYRLYATECLDTPCVTSEQRQAIRELRERDTREIAQFLQESAELLSKLTQSAVFLSAPRFDNDFIVDLKLVGIDYRRCMCVVVTDFGVVQTEILHVEKKLSAFALKRIEAYFHWRLTGLDKPEHFELEEEPLAQQLYNEVMMRYIVNYSHFMEESVYRTGFSKLLEHADFHDVALLSESLALFENAHSMRLLLRECCAGEQLKFWIGEDLLPYSKTTPQCTVIAVPYAINQKVVGGIGLLGPIRLPYDEVFGLMKAFAIGMGEALTRNLYKYKITFRQPHIGDAIDHKKERGLVESGMRLLENKRD